MGDDKDEPKKRFYHSHVNVIGHAYKFEWAIHVYIPIAPKKSFPRKGKPGLFANTIILKSGCNTMVLGLPSPLCTSLKKKQE